MRFFIEDHPDSLESIERDGQIVRVVGKGVMRSPGHPGGNQQFSSQIPILRAAYVQPRLFEIFNTDINDRTEYLGRYKLLEHTIKLSFAGFRYYEYKMMRVKPFIPSNNYNGVSV